MALLLLITQSCKKNNSLGNDAPKLDNPAIKGVTNLVKWASYKAHPANSGFSWMLIGDSYVNHYAEQLHSNVLSDGYADGGPGYCSFSRYDPIESYSFDQSIAPGELSFNYNPTQWKFTLGGTIGTNGYVTSLTANAIITVTSTVALSNMTLVYEKHATPETFMYRINGSAWKAVNISNYIPVIDTTVLDVSGAGKNITLEILPLNAGMNFCGVIGKLNGNKLIMNKCGIAGAQASYFAQNDEWAQAAKLLAPQGVTIQFGINEQLVGTTPAIYKIAVQNIINKVRSISPNCDVILISPPQTQLENEVKSAYKQNDYAKIMYQLSLDNNTAYINLSTAFGPFSQASVDNELMETDRIHPGTIGDKLIVNTIFAALKK